MNSAIAAAFPAGETVQHGAYKVDVSRGTMRDELSRQWWSRPDDERYTSLTKLRDATKRRYEASKESRVETKKVELFAPEARTIEDTQKLFVGLPTGEESVFTHWSFGQACALAKAPGAYLRALPSQLAADNINYSLRHMREVEEVKAYYHRDGGGQLHALTGPDYGRIPDYEMVQAVMQIAGDGDGSQGWKVPGVMNWANGTYNPYVDVTKENTTLFASDRDVFLFLVDDTRPIEVGKLADGSPDYMFRGFYAWNSETGSRSYGVAAMYLRGVCMNRCLWGVEKFTEFKGRHSKGAPDRFMYEARPALRSFAEGSAQTLIEGVTAAKAAIKAQDDEEALAFLRGRGFSRSKAAQIFETVEREEQRKPRSVWDFAQGITAVARKEPNQDTRLDLERQAGALLDMVA